MNSPRLSLSKLKAALSPYKNKLPGFFYNKSLHIIIGLCIIAIIVTSVWSANHPIEQEQDNLIISEEAQIEGVEQPPTQTTLEEGLFTEDIEKETAAGPTEQTVNEPVIAATDDEQAHKNKKKEELDLSTMMPPVIGKIIVDYSVDKLVYSDTLEQWQTHPGIDIAAEEGTAVKAVLDGTVVDTLNDSKLGNTVIIDHGAGFISKYGNLKSTTVVKKGQDIKKGEIIGAVGKSSKFESADPPHLHFEMEKDNSTMDPNIYLPKIE